MATGFGGPSLGSGWPWGSAHTPDGRRDAICGRGVASGRDATRHVWGCDAWLQPRSDGSVPAVHAGVLADHPSAAATGAGTAAAGRGAGILLCCSRRRRRPPVAWCWQRPTCRLPFSVSFLFALTAALSISFALSLSLQGPLPLAVALLFTLPSAVTVPLIRWNVGAVAYSLALSHSQPLTVTVSVSVSVAVSVAVAVAVAVAVSVWIAVAVTVPVWRPFSRALFLAQSHAVHVSFTVPFGRPVATTTAVAVAVAVARGVTPSVPEPVAFKATGHASCCDGRSIGRLRHFGRRYRCWQCTHCCWCGVGTVPLAVAVAVPFSVARSARGGIADALPGAATPSLAVPAAR